MSRNYVDRWCGKGMCLEAEGPGFKFLLFHSLLYGLGQVINFSVLQHFLFCKIRIVLPISKGCCVDICKVSVKVEQMFMVGKQRCLWGQWEEHARYQ